MNFFDKLGRLHTKVVMKNDDYPTNNAYCYSGYYKVLYPNKEFNCYLPETMPFSRHPDVLSVAISRDELYGVCMLSKTKAKEICQHLDNNYNQFCDLNNFKALPFYKLNWINVYKEFKALSKEPKSRTAVIKYPSTWNLAFWQRPEDRWMYKRAAGINPSLWEKAFFLVARGISVFRWKMEEPNLLLFFSLKHLEQEGNLGIEGRIIQMYMNTYVHDMYNNDRDMLKYATRDLPTEYYKEHPLITG